ncbi:hypothetical protein Tco_0422617 [Tanacetum coccineum]
MMSQLIHNYQGVGEWMGTAGILRRLSIFRLELTEVRYFVFQVDSVRCAVMGGSWKYWLKIAVADEVYEVVQEKRPAIGGWVAWWIGWVLDLDMGRSLMRGYLHLITDKYNDWFSDISERHCVDESRVWILLFGEKLFSLESSI